MTQTNKQTNKQKKKMSNDEETESKHVTLNEFLTNKNKIYDSQWNTVNENIKNLLGCLKSKNKNKNCFVFFVMTHRQKKNKKYKKNFQK